MVLISRYLSFRINLDAPPEPPFIQKGPGEVFAWGSLGGRLAKPHPPATGCRSPLAGQRGSELRSRSARPAELLDDPVGRSCRMSDGVDRRTLEILAREFGRMILSGTGVEWAQKGFLSGLWVCRL